MYSNVTVIFIFNSVYCIVVSLYANKASRLTL